MLPICSAFSFVNPPLLVKEKLLKTLSFLFLLLPFGRQSSKSSIVNHDMSSLMAQAISSWSRQVRQRRLAKHIEELRVDSDADAGGKPCAEVLPPTELSEQKDADEHS